MNIKRLVAIGSVALVVLFIMAGAVGAGSYTTGFETFNLGTVDGQDGWHSAVPGDIPLLPNGYDQAVVNTSSFGSPSGFGTKALRVSNAYSEPTAEFEFQTYSAPTPAPAGEGQTNTVFDGTFEFISTSANYQPGLMVSVSPDNGHGGRMSYLSLTDTPNDGIHLTFYETDADGNFVAHEVGNYIRNEVHTVRFLIEFVPGEANDIVRLFVDGVDIGDRDGLCFTTWEEFYRGVPQDVPVTDSFEFRTSNGLNCAANGATGGAGSMCLIQNLIGGGYLFDNVTTTTRADNGPAPTTCGVPKVGMIAPTGTTCQQYRDGTAPVLGELHYTAKGNLINSVSPGVFFYYTKVSGTTGQTVDITENTTPPYSVIPIHQGQAFLYDASTCTKLKWDVTTNGTATGTLPSDGDFILGVKYKPSALKRKEMPSSPPVTYSFETFLDGVLVDTGAAIDLAPKK